MRICAVMRTASLKRRNIRDEAFVTPKKRRTNFLHIIMKKKYKFLLHAIAWSVVATAATSCNVTRTVSTESKYFTKGDTTCTIVTKTIETYDASKK
jgi:hypothetical protein